MGGGARSNDRKQMGFFTYSCSTRRESKLYILALYKCYLYATDLSTQKYIEEEDRRKIRLIEVNAKCRRILIHTGGGGRDEPERRLDWQQFTKQGRKYKHD
jgi:hypothetical protein